GRVGLFAWFGPVAARTALPYSGHEIVTPLFKALQGYRRFVDEIRRARNGVAICRRNGRAQGCSRSIEWKRVTRRPGETGSHVCEAGTVAVEPGGFVAGTIFEAIGPAAGSSEAVPVRGCGIHRRYSTGHEDKQS